MKNRTKNFNGIDLRILSKKCEQEIQGAETSMLKALLEGRVHSNHEQPRRVKYGKSRLEQHLEAYEEMQDMERAA